MEKLLVFNDNIKVYDIRGDESSYKGAKIKCSAHYTVTLTFIYNNLKV